MRFFPPGNRFNEAEVRAKWIWWADQNIKGNAAIRRAAAEAAVQALARGSTVDQAVNEAFSVATNRTTSKINSFTKLIFIIGIAMTLFGFLGQSEQILIAGIGFLTVGLMGVLGSSKMNRDPKLRRRIYEAQSPEPGPSKIHMTPILIALGIVAAIIFFRP